MLKFFAPYKKFFIFLFFLSVVIIYFIYKALVPKEVLPIYEPENITNELVDIDIQEVRKNHKVGNFELTNHLGETITNKKYENTVYVADFFFTTCQTICPKMTTNMYQLQQKLKDKKVQLLSHTVMPEVDSVPVLNNYAQNKGVDASKWNLVTGSKKELYDLARKSYLVAKLKPYSEYDLIHTENFVLVDQKQRIRGYYDGTEKEAMQKLLNDIDLLLEK